MRHAVGADVLPVGPFCPFTSPNLKHLGAEPEQRLVGSILVESDKGVFKKHLRTTLKSLSLAFCLVWL